MEIHFTLNNFLSRRRYLTLMVLDIKEKDLETLE